MKRWIARRSGRAPIAGSKPFSTSISLAASVSSIATSCVAICSRSRFSCRSTIVRISSFSSLWKTMISSIRFSSSGRKTFFSSPMTRPFMSS